MITQTLSVFDEIVNEVERTNCNPGTSEMLINMNAFRSMTIGQRFNLHERFKAIHLVNHALAGSFFFIREHI